MRARLIQKICFVATSLAGNTLARLSFQSVPNVKHVIENGLEHPNAHYDGFVLSDVFVHSSSTGSGSSNGIKHTLIQRKLQFNQNRHLKINETSHSSLFYNLTEEISSLDASSDLSRLKIRGLAKLVFINRNFDYPNGFSTTEAATPTTDLVGNNSLFFNTSTFDEMKNTTLALWNAAKKEVTEIVNSINANVGSYDTQNDTTARTKTGIASLLFKRGSDSILVFHETVTNSDIRCEHVDSN